MENKTKINQNALKIQHISLLTKNVQNESLGIASCTVGTGSIPG